MPDAKELISLYFVDTPEEERTYAMRVAKQAAHFGITPDAAIEGERVRKAGAVFVLPRGN